MKQVTRELRGAYIKMLANLSYKGKTIPVKSYIQQGKGAVVTFATGKTLEAYINVINQYRSANSLKNGVGSKAYITLDINTVFSGNSYDSSGAEWVEEITQAVFDLLYDEYKFRLKEFGIGSDRFIITSANNFSQPMPLQYTDTSRAFRSVITFEHDIQWLPAETPNPDLWILTI